MNLAVAEPKSDMSTEEYFAACKWLSLSQTAEQQRWDQLHFLHCQSRYRDAGFTRERGRFEVTQGYVCGECGTRFTWKLATRWTHKRWQISIKKTKVLFKKRSTLWQGTLVLDATFGLLKVNSLSKDLGKFSEREFKIRLASLQTTKFAMFS